VDPVLLVDLERAEEQRFIGHDHCLETHDRPNELRDPFALDFVDRLEDIHELRNDEIDEDQGLAAAEELARSLRLIGRIAGQVTDEDVRVDEGAQPRS
jgi:hypothetical protein